MSKDMLMILMVLEESGKLSLHGTCVKEPLAWCFGRTVVAGFH